MKNDRKAPKYCFACGDKLDISEWKRRGYDTQTGFVKLVRYYTCRNSDCKRNKDCNIES